MNLKSLSDAALFDEIHAQARIEREAGIALLHCLREIECRRLHLKRGFPSLHEFLVKELHYSDGAAHRRLNAMRLLKDLPQVEEKLSQGTVNLTTVSQLQDFIRAERQRERPLASAQKLQLLEAITGKSSRETQAFLAELSPESAIPERVRMLSEEEVLIQFTVPREVLEKLDELKALLAHGLASPNGYGELIAKIADRVLKEEYKKRGKGTVTVTKPTDPAKRRPPRALARQVWIRAGHRCEYVDSKTSRRCDSVFALEIDHVRAWADGGETTIKNLQLLCSAHHRKKTEERMQV